MGKGVTVCCREGEFKMGKMHGVGLYTSASVGGKEGTKEEALMRDNILHCLKKGK